MSTENIGTLATPEDALIGSLERYLYGGQSIQTTTLVGILQLLKEQREANTELNRQVSALLTSQDNIINGLGIKGDGPVSKLVIEYVLGLVAESVALKEFIIDDCFIAREFDYQDAACEIPKSPATEAAIAEIKAQGVDEFLNDEFVQEVAMRLADFNGETEETVNSVVWSGMPPEPEGNVWELEYVSRASFLSRKLKVFSANLRAGRKG